MKLAKLRLQLETLEGRDCPSVTLSVQNGGHTLVLRGTAANDSVQITQDDAHDTLAVTRNGLTSSPESNLQAKMRTEYFKSSQITRIVVDLGEGNDSFAFEVASGSNFTFGKVFDINLGAGDDILNFETGDQLMGAVSALAYPDRGQLGTPVTLDSDQAALAGTTTAGTSIEGFLKLIINAGSGEDQVCINVSEIQSKTAVAVATKLGDGDDWFSLVSSGMLHDGSTLRVDVDGGAGNDSIYTSLRGTVEESAFASLTQTGGQGEDQLTVDLPALLLGRTQVKLKGGQGDDELHMTGNLQAGSTGQIQLQAIGGRGDDFVDCNFWPAPETNVDAEKSRFLGGDGTDKAMLSLVIPQTKFETVEYLAQAVDLTKKK